MMQKIRSVILNKECWKPVICRSVIGGRQVAGFKQTDTGEFMEIMPIRNSKDMDEFLEAYDISIAGIIVK